MRRGLLIRQVFVLVELTLAVTVVFVAYMVISKALEQDVPAQVDAMSPVDAGTEIVFTKIAALPDYDSLAKSSVFGKAGEAAPIAPAPPTEPLPVDPNPPEITDLPLKLWGTVAISAKDPLANAIIENTATKKGEKEAFFLGATVMDQVILEEVRPREVILFNKATNSRGILSMADGDDAKAPSGRAATARSADGASRPSSPNQITLTRAELEQDVLANMEQLTQINATPVTNESGEVTGLTAESISSMPLADKLGLKDGDELQQINGEKIDSVEKVMEVLQKSANLKDIRLGVRREGRMQMLRITLE